MPACPSCGQENPEGFRLCGMCGTPLAPVPSPIRETRKVVTIVFCDVTGSTSLGERLDPESLRQVMARYFESMRTVVERHGGTVEKFIGDAVMAVFGIPVVHEDDALRAVRSAAEMRAELEDLNDELERTYGLRIESRIGVNTGEVVAGDPSAGERYATGDAVNVAARLEQAANPGEIVVGEETYRLVRDAVEVAPLDALPVEGKTEAVPAFRLLEVTPGVAGHVRRLDTPLVGRDRELDLLRDAFARVARDEACHLFTVLGPPGVGKSRLVAEFLSSVEAEARAARGRCLPYGEGISYWPVIELVREGIGAVEDHDVESVRAKLLHVVADDANSAALARQLLEVLGLEEGTASPEESFWALRKLFEALARSAPLVLVLDDIQWGETTFLDLVEHLAEWARDVPMLLVCMARPDLLDIRPAWGGGKLNATTVLLEPLGGSEIDRLLGHLLAGGELASAVRARIAEAAGGNPLFVEEMVGMLVDEGLLQRENGHWTAAADLSSVPVPPTIRALLAARLDQLSGEERLVIERAAVEGQTFHQGAVAALAPEAPEVAANLLALVRRELIRPDRAAFPGDDAFRFRHLLIRDAAYEALPKAIRADLHERFADWLEGHGGNLSEGHAEIVGYHLEQAWRYRAELAPAETYTDLAARAGTSLAVAGRRAFALGDMTAVANLLGRATTLLPVASEVRLELLPIHAAALEENGRLEDARALLLEAIALGRTTGNRRLEWRARAAEAWVRHQFDPTMSLEEIEDFAQRAIDELDRIEDDFGLAYAWRLQGDVANTRGDGAGWIEAVRRGFDYGRGAGNRYQEWACLANIGGAMFFGPTPAEEAIATLEALGAEIGDDLLLESAIARPLGGFVAMQGRVEDGWALIERSRSIMIELGFRQALAHLAFVSGRVAAMTGDLTMAEREYRAGIQIYGEMGERGRHSTLTGELAGVVYELGRLDEAEQLAEEADALGGADDVSSQTLSLSVRGRVLARRGEIEAGERLVREAVASVEATDFLNYRAETLLDLAEVLELSGRPDDAVPLILDALELARRKGNVLLERQVSARLAGLR